MAKVVMPNEVGVPNKNSPSAVDNAIKEAAESTPNVSVEESPKKHEKIISGEAKERKRTFGDKVRDNLFDDDTASVKDYLIYDVLIPATKNVIYDMVSGGIETLLYGQRRSAASRGVSQPKTYTSYSSYSKQQQAPARTIPQKQKGREFDDIIIDNRADAEMVVDTLIESIKEYGTVTLADVYDLVGITSSYVDYRWGWGEEFIHEVGIRKTRNGWLIEFPPIQKLD